ncbi:MAG: hypothetical protein ABUS57_09300 [Pseudomonadota bacterium]
MSGLLPRSRAKVRVLKLLVAGALIASFAPAALARGNFDDALAAANSALEASAFNEGATTRLERTADCQGNLRTRWSFSVSESKGYSFVETVTPVDFSVDIVGVEHVPAHDDVRADHVERWSDAIHINFRNPIASVFQQRVIGSDETVTRQYQPPFISIGSEHATRDEVQNLLTRLRAIVDICHVQRLS